MPFIDDALLWCPDNDGRMVGGLDITTCLQEGNPSNNLNRNESTEASEGNCELNEIEPLCNDTSEELFRQLSESNFEIESLLSDLATVEQEENNNVVEHSLNNNGRNTDENFVACGNITNTDAESFHEEGGIGTTSTESALAESTETALLALAASVVNCSTQQNQNISINCSAPTTTGSEINEHPVASNRFSIAANPLLAEKLLSNNGSSNCLRHGRNLETLALKDN